MENTEMEVRRTEEMFFLNMHTEMLREIQSEKNVSDRDIREAVQAIKKSFLDYPFSFGKLDFNRWDYMCGYVFRYGALGAGFARFMILNALRNCNEVRSALDKDELRVLSLGSGPGNDAVGFCSALSEIRSPDKLIINAVDKFEAFGLGVEKMKNILKKEKMGKVSELFQSKDVNFSFIQVDLPGNTLKDVDYFQALKEADIIVMCKLLSNLDFGTSRKIIQSLYENMKNGALILFINPFSDNMADMWNNFNTLYQWRPEDPYKPTAISPDIDDDDSVSAKVPITVLTRATTKAIE